MVINDNKNKKGETTGTHADTYRGNTSSTVIVDDNMGIAEGPKYNTLNRAERRAIDKVNRRLRKKGLI